MGSYAFSGCDSLTSVTIPNSVTDVGEYPFYGCHNLAEIKVANGNETYRDIDGVLVDNRDNTLITYPLGKQVSQGKYTIPSGITGIREGAFSACKSLTEVKIPYGVTSIGERAFSNCESLTEVKIPGSVTSIGVDAFRGCSALKSVTIPNSITKIEVGVFNDCSSLTSVTIPPNVTSIGDSAFAYCKGLTAVTIPNGVTSIAGSAFLYCEKLTEVSFSSRVTSIGQNAFLRSALKDVYFKGSKDQWTQIVVSKGNDLLLNANIHYGMILPESNDPEWVYVQKLTQNSLSGADEETKALVNLAINNLLFKAYYRPIKSTIPKKKIANTVSFTGSLAVMSTWRLQNDRRDANGKLIAIHPDTKYFDDPILGHVDFAEGGWGCMSYALFATAYTYGTSGSKVTCTDLSANGIKTFFHEHVDPGEQIRWEPPKNGTGKRHSIAFLGEDDSGEGIYYITYSGGRESKDNGKLPADSTKHNLSLAYMTYDELAKKVKGLTLTIRDANGGSYNAGTAKPAGDVRESKKVTRNVVIIACPVEAVIQYEGETLDSRLLNATNFGTVTRNGEEIIFDLAPNIDYELEIIGTGEGTMNLTLEYYNEDTVVDTRAFEKYPITESMEIQAGRFDPLASFVLYGETEDGEAVVWGTGINETVTDETVEDVYSCDNSAPIDNVFLDVSFANGDGELYIVSSLFANDIKNAYAIAALYDSDGKQREVVVRKLQEDEQEYTFPFKATPADSDNVKVFLLDQSYSPLYDGPLPPNG